MLIIWRYQEIVKEGCHAAAFLDNIEGALTKALLVRDEDVQVLHGFDSKEHAAAYLESDLFKNDVVKGLSPYFQADPEIRIFSVAG